jgi:OmpA-OmpF porin, OOP family
VPDRLDKEPNTKKGCPVDVHGVILDSDKDGIPDCDDKEPFSPPGYPIDANGVAIIPPNPCCDNAATGSSDNDYVINPKTGKPYLDEEGKPIHAGPPTDEYVINPKTGKPYLDENGNPIKNPNYGKKRSSRGGQYDCSKMEMPGVFFDEDRYSIDPAYQSALHQVAEKLQMCPDVRMVITGVDESKNDQKYNEQLAYNRASSVVDYLVEKYGISRDRFVVKYVGGKKSDANKTPTERKQARRVDINYAADGEKGESNPPAPHPGLKAGSNK